MLNIDHNPILDKRFRAQMESIIYICKETKFHVKARQGFCTAVPLEDYDVEEIALTKWKNRPPKPNSITAETKQLSHDAAKPLFILLLSGPPQQFLNTRILNNVVTYKTEFT